MAWKWSEIKIDRNGPIETPNVKLLRIINLAFCEFVSIFDLGSGLGVLKISKTHPRKHHDFFITEINQVYSTGSEMHSDICKLVDAKDHKDFYLFLNDRKVAYFSV